MFHNTIKTISNSAGTLAKTIVLPDEHDPTRVPSYPNIERTAVLSFKATDTQSVGEAGLGVDAVMLVPCPAAPVWRTSVVSSTLVEYSEDWNTKRTTLISGSIGASVVTAGSYNANKVVLGAGILPILAKNIPLGILNSEKYIYIPQGAYGFVRVAPVLATSIAGTLTARLKFWTGGDTVVKKEMVLNVATYAFMQFIDTTSIGSCWMNLDSIETNTGYAVTGSTFTDVTIGWATSSSYISPAFTIKSLFPISTCPESDVSIVPWEDVRITAASVLVTNTTKVLNKEGTVLCARLSCAADSSVFGMVTKAKLDRVHPSFRYFGPLEHGAYSYLPPTAALNSFTSAIYNDGTAIFPVVNLANVDFVQQILMTDPDGSNITNMAVTAVWHTEFRTSSTLFTVASSSTPLQEYHAATLAVSTMPMFTENWIHVPTILNWLRTNIPKALAAVSIGGYRLTNKQNKPPPRVTVKPRPVKVAKQPKKQKPQAKPKMASGLDLYLASKKKK